MKSLIFRLIVLLSVLIITGCSVSKRITITQSAPTDSVFIHDVDISELEKKYSDHDAVYLNVKNIYEHSVRTANPLLSVRPDWDYDRIKSIKYLVLNPENQELSTVKFDTHPNAVINSFYLVVNTPGAEIKRYSLKDLVVEKDAEGYLTYKFGIPGIKKGSLVEYGTDITYDSRYARPPLEYLVELQYPYPCEHLELKFGYPDWWEIRSKQIAPDVKIDYTFSYNVEENKKILQYYSKNIPAIKKEIFSLPFFELAKYLRFNITLIDLGIPVNLTKNWKEIADTYKEYAMNKESFLSTSVGNKTDEIAESCSTDFSKMEAIVNFIQQSIKVTKDDKDRSFAKVLETGEGTIYEICGLTEAMLSDAELETDYLLIHSSETGYLDTNFISYDQFHIPAVRVKIDETDYVIFPYYKYLPIDHIPSEFQEQRSLIVSNDDSRHAKFWNLPVGKMSDNKSKSKFDIKVNNDGSLNVVEEKTAGGSLAFELRDYLDDLSPDEFDKAIKKMPSYSEGDIKIIKSEILNREDYKSDLVVRLEYIINNLITITPEEVILQTGGLFSPSSNSELKIDTLNRVNPIFIPYDQFFEKEIRITYPENWQLATELNDTSFENDFGKISSTYLISNNLLHITQSSELKKIRTGKERITDLDKIYGGSNKQVIPALIFTVKSVD